MTSKPSNNLPQRDFAKLLVQHQPKVTLYIRAFIFRKADAEDLAQEVAAKAWEQFDQYDPARPFEAWLITIAKFEVLSYIRDAKRSRLVFNEDTLDQLASTMHQMQDRNQLPTLDALERCLARVPNDDRELLRQRFELNKPGKDIAQALNISSATVSRRLQRVYAQLLICVRGLTREEASA